MKYRVQILEPAFSDLESIYDYITRDRPAAAETFTDRLFQSIGSLDRMPQRGARPKDPMLKSRGYRYLVHGDYLIFFKIEGRRVRVYRIIHGRRRFEHLL